MDMRIFCIYICEEKHLDIETSTASFTKVTVCSYTTQQFDIFIITLHRIYFQYANAVFRNTSIRPKNSI